MCRSQNVRMVDLWTVFSIVFSRSGLKHVTSHKRTWIMLQGSFIRPLLRRCHHLASVGTIKAGEYAEPRRAEVIMSDVHELFGRLEEVLSALRLRAFLIPVYDSLV
jgi:hypothetical protein